MVQKSNRFDNFFNPDDDIKYLKNGPSSDPYQYGPVGQQDAQPIGISPPTSPGLQPTNIGNDTAPFNNPNAGSDVGQYNGSADNGVNVGPTTIDPGLAGNDVMYNGPNHTPVYGLRDPGFTPLIVGVAGAAAAAGAATAGRNNRPGTSSSGRYSSGSDLAGQQASRTSYHPQQFNAYPPALATYAQQQQQGFGAPPTGHGQPVFFQNAGNPTLSPPSGIPGNTAGASGSSNLPQMAGAAAMPIMMQGQFPQQQYWQTQQPQQQRYEDTFARTATSGSSTQENPNQVLQVVNADTGTFAEGSSTPGLTIVGSSPSGSQDGKGRQLYLRGEKVPLVHLDGGAYQEASTPAPPAYME